MKYSGKYKIGVLVLALLLFAGCMYMILAYNAEVQREKCEEIIKRDVSIYFFKRDANAVTEEVIANLKNLFIRYGSETFDLKPFEKFKSLQYLYFMDSSDGWPVPPKPPVPKWKLFLAKFRIIDLEKKDSFNLKPIGKLANLEELKIGGELIFDIKPLAKLTRLKSLTLICVRTTDLTPVKNLVNLEVLGIGGESMSNLPLSNIEPIKNLKNLKVLKLYSCAVTDLEPIRGLTNLELLDIRFTLISNLEPIKDLKNLKTLYLRSRVTFTQEQLNDLKKALPDLKIITNEI